MANRIKTLRVALGLSRKALAESAGTTANQLVKLENGDRRLSDHWASRLAPALGIAPFELMLPKEITARLRFVPVLGWVSCGTWGEALENATEMVPTVYGGPRSFALRPEGDSLDLLVEEGGYLIVDPDEAALNDGKSYVIMDQDYQATAKVYRSDPARFEPCSSNPAHKPLMVGAHPFTVVGRIVGVMRGM